MQAGARVVAGLGAVEIVDQGSALPRIEEWHGGQAAIGVGHELLQQAHQVPEQ